MVSTPNYYEQNKEAGHALSGTINGKYPFGYAVMMFVEIYNRILEMPIYESTHIMG